MGPPSLMRLSRKFLIILIAALSIELMLVWSVVRDKRSRPYHVDRSALSGWHVVLGAGDDPWVVALEPPASLTKSLFEQVATKVDRRLVAPQHVALPLVMRPEYDDALQGVYGAMDIQRMAKQEMTGESTVEPVCIGRRADSQNGEAGELYFLAVNSEAFNALRLQLRPDFPEHAGIGIYDPGAMTPVLPIATTDANFARWWPIRLERITDCQAQVLVD
jgi:hypothetical protein